MNYNSSHHPVPVTVEELVAGWRVIWDHPLFPDRILADLGSVEAELQRVATALAFVFGSVYIEINWQLKTDGGRQELNRFQEAKTDSPSPGRR